MLNCAGTGSPLLTKGPIKTPAKVETRIRRIETATKRLEAKHLIYSYGGGRVDGRIIDPPKDGERWTDCSGFATYLCDVAAIKLKNEAGSTWSLAEEGEPGVSPYFTLFIKNNPGDEHVIVRLRERPKPWHSGEPRYRWVECGGTDNPSAGGGPSYFIPGKTMGMPSEQRIKEFGIHRQFDHQLLGKPPKTTIRKRKAK